MNRIHDRFQRVFQRHRLVFWYDATGEWVETCIREGVLSFTLEK